ncbi:uncharacterized protein LOC125230318 [Leguminivora glycinivorella]|uniref:uncharacterized protein LOC125230318 n=1 Tax=Leguminivora glycinivorella TaxID=1035111 RepID=UPI0020104866|nr:uncharacterized protein LOC125230318 [Leguminivora glycinivorella]
MKSFVALFFVLSTVYARSLLSNQLAKNHHKYGYGHGLKRCVNMWDEGCINGQLGGSGSDDYYLGGSFNPGKRCVNMWDEGCINDQLGGAGKDDYYLGGSFNPGKRCVNMWDEGCINGQLGGSGGDDYYLNGGFTPGRM